MKTHCASRTAGLVGLALLATVGPAGASPGDRVQRHPTIACSDCRDPDIYPAVASDAAGNSLVVWVKIQTELAQRGVWGRWFDASGAPSGVQFRISPQDTSPDVRAEAASLAMRPDGTFVVTWIARAARSATDFVQARLFDRHGVPTSGVVTVSAANHEPINGWGNPPPVDVDDDGDFVVSWTSRVQGTNNYVVWARLFGPTGTPKGPEFNVDPTGPSPRIRFADVAMDPAGKFVVVWRQGNNEDTAASLFGRRFGAGGAALGSRFVVSAAGPGIPANPEVAMARDGRFTTAFNRYVIDPSVGVVSLGIYGRRFGATGAPLAGEFLASSTGRSTYRGEVGVAMDADGDFVVAWIERQPGFGQTDLHSRLYAASGTPITTDRAYGFDHANPRFERVAMDAVGNYVATWEHSSEGPGGAGVSENIYVQHFAGPDDTRAGCAAFIAGIVGTAANDSLQGTGADDVVAALGGNDVVTGGGGNDLVCGGAGNDQLFGEAGLDQLRGGAGDDVLDGGDDDDTCNGNGEVNADTALQCETVLQVP
jgi:hypothetical protein